MAGEKYTNIGKARWENANVGVIKWDPENKAGLASVIDETTGTVYEIGGGGGEGGESDFSTATVTVSDEITPFSIPTLIISPEYNLEGAYASTENLTSPYTIILYKGKAYLKLENVISTTGDISLDNDTGLYIVTGDCSITFGGIH